MRHWRNRFGAFDGPSDPALCKPFGRKVAADLLAFGMNTLGCHSPTWPYERPPCPYIHTVRFVDICHWQSPQPADFRDVFGPEFERHCARVAREQIAPRRDDPLLIGYAFTDCPIWTEVDAGAREVCTYGNARRAVTTWPGVLRNLGAEAPGKLAYVELMRQRHAGDINQLSQVYGTRLASFDALARATDWRLTAGPANEVERADNATFLEHIVERYYQVVSQAVRRYDPNHLVLGDKLNGNTSVPADIVRMVGRYVDALLYQWYGHYEEQKPTLDSWATLAGLPLLNGDCSFSVPDEHMPQPLGPHSANQAERAEAFRAYAENAFARSDFIGWNWCGWMDSWEVSQPGRQHSGVQTAFGEYYEPARSAMADFGARMYRIASGR